MERTFMNSDRQLSEFVVERKMWIAASKQFRDDMINKVVKFFVKNGADKEDPFFISKVVTNMQRNVYTPYDYVKRGVLEAR